MKQNLSTLQKRYVPLFILLFCLATLLFACMGILAQGFGPADDALRHVAKVISGKTWPEILLIRPEITMDSHPGWHAILSGFYKLTTANADKLLILSVVFFFSLFAIVPAFFFRRPEAWILTFLIMAVFSFLPLYRVFYGRPFIFSMFVTVFFCFLWERLNKPGFTIELAAYTIVVALSTWIHGAWYLMSLPLAALFLARQWRPLWLLGVSTVAGVFLGALFTGKPIVFLHQMVFHAVEAFRYHVFQHQLVTEFQPFDGAGFSLVPIIALLLWRRASGKWETKFLDNPAFYLGALGWGMGFITLRFWTDWGWPAIMVWIAVELQRILEKNIEVSSLKRLGVAAVICVVFYLAFTNDYENRWTHNAGAPWPDMENPIHRPWLPDEGGILYNNRMLLFYNVFYNNPHGPWRYALGFESVWMPIEDLKIYRQIQLSRHSPESFSPWIDKMTKKDRMMLIFDRKPDIPRLEWYEVVPLVWSGRLPVK